MTLSILRVFVCVPPRSIQRVFSPEGEALQGVRGITKKEYHQVMFPNILLHYGSALLPHRVSACL